MEISRVNYTSRLGEKKIYLPTHNAEIIENVFGVHRNRITSIDALVGLEANIVEWTTPEPGQKEVCDLFQALGQLFSLGVDPVGGLNLLTRRSRNVKMSQKLMDITQSIQQGDPIADAFGKYSKLFGETSVHLIRAGAATGNLGRAFESLADNMTKMRTIARRVQSALVYPAVVLTVIYIVVEVFCLAVIPKLAEIYDQFQALQELPFITTMMRRLSETILHIPVFQDWPGFIQGCILFIPYVILALIVWSNKEKISRSKWFNDLMRVTPGLKDFVWKKNLTQVSTTLALLLESGLPLTEALEFSSRVVSDPKMALIFTEIRDRLEEGELVNEAFGSYADDLGPDGPRLVMAVEVGDATGSLAPLITKIAHSLEEEFDIAAQNLNRILEPMVILFIAGVVGILVYSVYYPMFTLGQHMMQQSEGNKMSAGKP
ncbi:MAG: type II secretion system F family protein [Verrucomicrobiota bacterium]